MSMSAEASEEWFRAACWNRLTRVLENAMSTTNPAGKTGTTRSIDKDRLERALTDSFTVRDHGPMTYLVARDGHDDHLVDVEKGYCDGKDAHFRNTACTHMVRASLHHLFTEGANTRLVARVARAINQLGCPHENDCGGPCAPGRYPCPECVAATNTDDWTVWTTLVRDVGGERE